MIYSLIDSGEVQRHTHQYYGMHLTAGVNNRRAEAQNITCVLLNAREISNREITTTGNWRIKDVFRFIPNEVISSAYVIISY